MLAEWLDLARVWIEQIIVRLGYPGIALMMLAENVFPPIPSELVMPFAGFLAARGQLSLAGVLLAGGLGSVAGALLLYGLGAWVGDRVLRAWVRRWGRWWLLAEADLDRALGVFARFGGLAVLVGRLVPLVRSVISVPAGVDGMPLGRFLLLTLAGTSVWNGLMAGAGYWLGARWEVLLGFAKQYERGALLVLAALALVFVIQRLARRRPRSLADPADR